MQKVNNSGEQPGLVLLPLLVQLDNLSHEGHLYVERPVVGVDCPQIYAMLQTILFDIKVVPECLLLMGEAGILLCLV